MSALAESGKRLGTGRLAGRTCASWWWTTMSIPHTAWPCCCASWVTTCESPTTVRAACRQALRYRPSLVFLDIALPKLSGHAVAQCLRARFGSHQMRLVAMTGFGNADDRMRSSAAGFDQHLVKPVEWSAIQATLESSRLEGW